MKTAIKNLLKKLEIKENLENTLLNLRDKINLNDQYTKDVFNNLVLDFKDGSLENNLESIEQSINNFNNFLCFMGKKY